MHLPIPIRLLVLTLAIGLVAGLASKVPSVYAAAINLTGSATALSAGGSVSMTDQNAGVALDDQTGELSGYAWSEDGGWIAMGSEDNPGGPVTVDLQTGAVTGKATMLSTGEMIDFAANNSNVVMTIPTGQFSGFVFSTDFGWIDFSTPGVSLANALPSVSPTPRTDQLMRGGKWFKDGILQPYSFVKKPTPTPTPVYAVGDTGPAGGIIFYDKGSYSDGWRYLEAPTTDQAVGIEWGCAGKSVTGAVGTAIGTGEANTYAIVIFHDNPANFNDNQYSTYSGSYATIGCHSDNDGSSVAKVAADYSQNGYTDWFIPSEGELAELFAQRNLVGNFAADNYWSSTQSSATSARRLGFYNGAWDNKFKTSNYPVRVIRSF